MLKHHCHTMVLILALLGQNISLHAQDMNITGKVTDASSNEPLIGASIVIVGTTKGTITDDNGNYSLAVPPNAELKYSYIGYEPQTVNVVSQRIINIQLALDLKFINEVIVIGYGEMRKSDVTGAVTSIKSEDISKVKANNALEVLQGSAAGVDIIKNNGQAGTGYSIKIRGQRSLTANNDPLYIVDGVDYGSTININPNDIASIEILKDAASTAIYGFRGANGVVLITTRKGEKGRPVVSFNAYYGITSRLGKLPVADRDEYLRFHRDLVRVSRNDWTLSDSLADVYLPLSSSEKEGIENGTNTDWLDLVWDDYGRQEDYYLSVRGGSEKTDYMVSANYFTEKGYVRNDSYDRFTIKSGINSKVNKYLELGNSNLISAIVNEQGDNPTGLTYMSPLLPAYDSTGEILVYPDPSNQAPNPLTSYQYENRRRNEKQTRILSSLHAQVNFTDNFDFRTTGYADISHRTNFEFYKPFEGVPGQSTGSIRYRPDYNLTWTNLLNFNKEFGAGKLNITLGHEMQYRRGEDYGFSGTDFELSDSWWWTINSANEITIMQNELLREEKSVSFFNRIHYNFKEKYIVSATIRFDGASQLSEGHKWDYFPSGSLAWRLSEEDFMKNIQAISSLKLRFGWGISGNKAIDPYKTFGATISIPMYYQFGISEEPAFGYRTNQIYNPNLSWEKTRAYNLGIDYGFFSNRLRGSLELYQTYTKDLLLERQLPPSAAISTATQNVGETFNQGIELSVGGEIIKTKYFSWTADFIFSANHNEITALYSGATQEIGSRWFVGEPVAVFYDLKQVGIWQITDSSEYELYNSGIRPGDVKFLDVNKDTAISQSADRVVIGQQDPKWYGGLKMNFTYKNFGLSTFIFGRFGHTVIDEVISDWVPDGKGNTFKRDYWTPDNPTNKLPRPFPEIARQSFSEAWPLAYSDGSFVKIKDITLAYTVPQNIISRFKISKLNVYITLKNYFVLYSPIWYNGNRFDPEARGDNDWPIPKILIFGINTEF